MARTARQQRFRLFAAVPPKVFMQQIDHGPQMASLFHIDLKEVAHVVQRGGGLS